MKLSILFIIWLFVVISCSSQSVSEALDVEVNGSDLLIFSDEIKTKITDVIVPELGSIVTIKKNGSGFFLTNMYTASYTKGMVYFSFSVFKGEVLLDRMFQMKLDSKNGIAFGWQTIFNNQYDASVINSSLLRSLTDVISYSINDSVVVIRTDDDNKLSIKRTDSIHDPLFEFPIFYNNEILVGQPN